MLEYNVSYSGSETQVSWQGNHVNDTKVFRQYLSGPTKERLTDKEGRDSLEADLRALATTDMASDTLKALLSSDPERKPWEVGEALAESLLEEEYEISWPWNMERDKRTPKASLPGADLVGFITTTDGVTLVLGEVKTSSEERYPPNVMTGRSGMCHQIDALASNIQIHFCLIQWLHVRCKNTDSWALFKKSVKRYLESKGQEIILFGILMRDTSPNEKDLSGRAKSLAKRVNSPTQVELHAWYCPELISKWPMIVTGGTS